VRRYEARLSGAGGQGIILAGVILAEAAGVHEGRRVVQTQSYGPESRGSACKCDVVVGDRDGVMVIPADELERSLALAVKREEKEAASRQALAAGKKTIELLGLRPILQQLGVE